jgi:phosphomannomutase
MAENTQGFDVSAALDRLETAAAAGKLSTGAVENIRKWLIEPRYARYAAQVAQHLAEGKWRELDDAFWTVIPFGTGGRRGRMYPIGSNAINDRTIGESAQGLAQYVKEKLGSAAELSCAIAYDTRHRSRHFAELCAGIMVAAGFKVFFLDDYRSTPELSFLVRYKSCTCGIMVTASHNPPSDNAVKVYWSTGGQLVPPDDKAVIERVMNVAEIEQADFAPAVADGRIVFCKDEVDAAFIEQLKAQRFAGPRDAKIIYSPLHGVGESAVLPVLTADGFADVEVFEPHRERSGDFPNVPGHVSNPENAVVFEAIIQRAQQVGAHLILATDPDCDRMGCAAPLTQNTGGPWGTFSGNQIAVMLADYVLEQRQKARTLSPEHYVIKTLVTTDMVRRIADSYGVKTYGDVLVGYKWICQLMDQKGPDKFAYGCEESHGYLVGQYARDKDGAVACMLMAELAAAVKATGKSLHEKLDALYWQHGYHAERLLNVKMEGSEGMTQMKALMTRFRQQPPSSLAGLEVVAVRDYLHQVKTPRGGQPQPIAEPKATDNLLIFDLAATGNYVAVRPSGTEPKVKFYMFTYVPAEQLADLSTAKREMETRLDAYEFDLRAFADSV